MRKHNTSRTGNQKLNRKIFANGLFSYDKLEPRHLLAAIAGSEAYEPQAIADPFVYDAVTLKDMVARAEVMPYMSGELIVAISVDHQGTGMEAYVDSINWNQTLGPQFLQTDQVDSTRTMLTVDRDGNSVSLVHLHFGDQTDVFTAMEFLDRNTSVLWSSPNFYQTENPIEYTPNDPQYGDQYHHPLMGNDLAWDVTLGNPDIIVGITDDGVDLVHEDLTTNIWVNAGETAGDGIDNDGNGYIDDVNGWDFINGNNDPTPDQSSHSHGTHVSGIAAGRTDNSIGIAGTAGQATILPLQFYNYGSWPASAINETFTYAADNGAHIVSTSYNINGWVGDPVFTAGLQYMYDAGVLPLNSAGNAGQLNPVRQAFHQTILVASSDSDDGLSSFTNYGTGIDIVAPGGGILSTLPGNSYGNNSGTSMAAPNAAGVAALIWSANPDWTRDQVAAQLLGTADNIDAENPSRIGLMGAGRVNSGNGVTATLGAPQLVSAGELPDDGEYRDDTTIDTFTLRFDQVMDPDSINDTSNFELLSAGNDGVFDTADDVVLPLSYNTYMISTNELVFDIVSGPMNYGLYRFTITSDGVKNPFDTPLDGDGDGTGGDDHIREFHIAPPLLSFDSPSYAIGDTVTVVANDGNAGATIQVTLTTLSGDSETLTMSGAGSIYMDSIVSVAGAAIVDDGQLQVVFGDTITATYMDVDDGTGNPATITTTAIIDNITEYPSTDTPIAITDNNTIVSTITVTDAGTLVDADLELNITHTWDADLDATLTAPDGSVFVLFDRIGGNGDNFQITYFDDDAAISINDGSAPFDGAFRPDQPFAPMNGISVTGDWTLTITDNATFDTGFLNAWSVFLNVAPLTGDVGGITDTDTATNEVSEDAEVGDSVGLTAFAEDPDINHDVTYELTDNAGGRFSIDEISGVVTVFAPLDYETATTHSIVVRANSTDGSFSVETFDIAIINVDDAVISTRNIFYQGSGFDGSDDFDAVATDKSVLRDGETATFANYSSYWLGLNGLALEVNDLNGVPTVGTIGDFFEFKVGNDDTPGDWPTAPTPTGVTVQSNIDASGTDRVFLTWEDNAIENEWLQITIFAGSTTGLVAPDVFYFGSVIAETGNRTVDAKVNLQDVAFTRQNQSGFGTADIGNRFDFDRSGKVNLADVGIARANQSGFAFVNLITPGSGKGFVDGANDSNQSNDALIGAQNGQDDLTDDSDVFKRRQQSMDSGLSRSLILSGSQTDDGDDAKPGYDPLDQSSTRSNDQSTLTSLDDAFEEFELPVI